MLLSACLVGVALADPRWSLQTIDKDAYVPGFLAVDSKNNPHILYHPLMGSIDNFNKIFWDMYTTYNGFNWTSHELKFDGMISILDFKLDSHDTPHVLCAGTAKDLNYTYSNLLYGTWNGNTWAFQTIDSYHTISGPPGSFGGSLAFDSQGNPYVAYTVDIFRFTEGELKYAALTGNGWNPQTIDVDVDGGVHLGVDSSGIVHLLYSKSGNVIHALLDSGSWNTQVIVENASKWGGVVFDSHGNPRFLYVSSDNSLMYSKWTGSAWDTQSLPWIEHWGWVALDSHDQLHLDFLVDGDLTYASLENSMWVTQIVDHNDLTPGPLVIDSNDNPHISYGGEAIRYGRAAQMYAHATTVSTLDSGGYYLLIIVGATFLIVTAVVVYVVWRKKP
jgi:hypothetical protein